MNVQRRTPPPRAFTIIELLIVVGIIIVLLSIVIVAVNSAVRTSQAANTQALMNSISQGLVQFRNDIGYLPPVLATPPADGNPNSFYKASRDYAPPPNGAGMDKAAAQRRQNWFSITTIPEYLLGYGDATEVGYGANNPVYDDQGKPQADGPLGIRHPGSDGYWGLSIDPTNPSKFGTLPLRRQYLENDPSWRRYLQGRSYGPYFELRDDRLLGAIDPNNATPNPQTGQYQVYFPGDALPGGLTWDEMPKVIVDHWGQPIRFYRKPYMPGMPGQDIRLPQDGRLPSLSDVFALRPYRPGEAVDNFFADAGGDTTTTTTLNAASFGLLSSGPDRRLDQTRRADPEEYNRDNIVEIGR